MDCGKEKGHQLCMLVFILRGQREKYFCQSQICATDHHFKIIRTYYRHTCLLDFRHIIVTVHDYTNVQQDLAMVVYKFDHQDQLYIKPHGNTTKKLTQTNPSTIHLLKTEVDKRAPKYSSLYFAL